MVIYYYLQFSRTFHWKPDDMDNMDIDLFYDYIIVSALEKQSNDKPQKKYIDQVMGF